MSRRVAIVTGAAGGIGAATARRLLRDGYAVTLVDCNEAALAELAENLNASGASILPLAGDLADLEFVDSIPRKTLDHFERVDLLVNNAAWREITTMRDISPASWERTLRVCLTAPAFLARDAARHFEFRGRGVIINVGSMMSQQAAGISPAYVACKGALESLTYELASLYGPSGVRVITLAPGAIDTSVLLGVGTQRNRADDDLRAYAQSMASLGRFGGADEIAAAIAWMASDDASYLTGTTVTIDGGWSRRHLPTALAIRSIEVSQS